jgi:hypothetical protein
MTKITLIPKCCLGTQHLAITNRGHLIPCCYVDTPLGTGDPKIQELLKVSKISENNSIETILNTREWVEFEKMLLNPEGPWPEVCVHYCQKRSDEDLFRKQETFDASGKIHERTQ